MQDAYYMNVALELAKSVQGQTSPNPPVGAVIVKNAAIIGMGAHMKQGEDHAEIVALKMAGDKANGATMYVTLEPCSHVGATPACVDAIIQQGIRRVVIASKDCNSLVNGKGVEELREAQIDVEQGVLSEESDALYEMFFYYIEKGLPYVTLKTAMSLDGKIATKSGDSKWITGEMAREDVHRYRHIHDAILVGVGTVLSDNPQLTTRLPHGKNPIRVILDSHLRTPIDANIVKDGKAPTWIFVQKGVCQKRISRYESFDHLRIVVVDSGELEIASVLKTLGENNISSLFVEGGAEIHGSFLKSGFINQYICYLAPKLVGGKFGKTSIGGEGITQIVDAFPLKIRSVDMIGDDIRIIGLKERV